MLQSHISILSSCQTCDWSIHTVPLVQCIYIKDCGAGSCLVLVTQLSATEYRWLKPGAPKFNSWLFISFRLLTKFSYVHSFGRGLMIEKCIMCYAMLLWPAFCNFNSDVQDQMATKLPSVQSCSLILLQACTTIEAMSLPYVRSIHRISQQKYKASGLTCAQIYNLDKEGGVLGAYPPEAVGKMWEGVSPTQSAKSPWVDRAQMINKDIPAGWCD